MLTQAKASFPLSQTLQNITRCYTLSANIPVLNHCFPMKMKLPKAVLKEETVTQTARAGWSTVHLQSLGDQGHPRLQNYTSSHEINKTQLVTYKKNLNECMCARADSHFLKQIGDIYQFLGEEKKLFIFLLLICLKKTR